MRTFLLKLLLLISFSSFSQPFFSYPFLSGEKVNYSVYYNLAWVWVDAAEVSFYVKDTVYRNKKSIYFSSIGRSKPNYDWVFKVRDHFSSFVYSENLSPIKYHRNTREGSHKVNNYYWFDNYKKIVYSFISDSDKGKRQDSLFYNKNIFDILSATYFLRTINFSAHSIGDTIPVNTVMDNEIIRINVVYLGEELMLHKNNSKYPSYKFKTKGVEGSIFDEKSEIVVWVSKDENKIPLKIETKILVGSIKAYINWIKNPKKNSSVIKDFVIQ